VPNPLVGQPAKPTVPLHYLKAGFAAYKEEVKDRG
jgi:hypothetical protein